MNNHTIKKKARNIRPPWSDVTSMDLNQYRLSPQQILERKKLLMSPNNMYQRRKMILHYALLNM